MFVPEKGVISCYLGIMRNPEMESPVCFSSRFKVYESMTNQLYKGFLTIWTSLSGSPWTWSNRRRNSRKALPPKIDPQSRSWRKSPAKLSVSRSMSLDPTLRYLHRITTWRNCEDFLIDGVAQPTSQEQILNDYKKTHVQSIALAETLKHPAISGRGRPFSQYKPLQFAPTRQPKMYKWSN